MGVWEIKRMMDKVSIIQKWWRSVLLTRYDRSIFVKKCKAIMRVQEFVRLIQRKAFETRLAKMEDSFQHFNQLRN